MTTAESFSAVAAEAGVEVGAVGVVVANILHLFTLVHVQVAQLAAITPLTNALERTRQVATPPMSTDAVCG